MEGNCLKWTCSDAAIREIRSKNVYRESLGFKLNSLWYLCILKTYLCSPLSSYEDECYCQFILIRESFTDPVTATVRFYEDSSCFFEKNVVFGDKTNHIEECGSGSITIARLKASKVTIAFFFKQHAKPQKLLQDVSFKKTDNLGEDYLSLLREEHLADVKLKCGSEAVNAHKVVLCARSPVFKAMFGNEMQETKTNTVTIDDMDASVFHAWIDFVYGGEVLITSVSLACGLLDAAEKYQTKSLKEVCIQYLETSLSSENAVQLLEVANLYDNQFKTKVVSYMSDHLSDLKTSKEWQDLKSRKPALALEVYSHKEQ